MKTTTSRKLILACLSVFVLFLAFSFFSYLESKKIETSVTNLAGEKIPGLIAAGNLKRAVQAQTIALYELYATADVNLYDQSSHKNATDILVNTSQLESLAEYKLIANSFDQKISKQNTTAKKFVEVMTTQEVDWDAAREALAQYSSQAKQIEDDLDMVVSKVSEQTQRKAESSKQGVTLLLLVDLIFSGLLIYVLGFVIMEVRSQAHS